LFGKTELTGRHEDTPSNLFEPKHLLQQPDAIVWNRTHRDAWAMAGIAVNAAIE
jgi:hypothetical protein